MKRDAIFLMESAWSDSSACKWSCKGLCVVFFPFNKKRRKWLSLPLSFQLLIADRLVWFCWEREKRLGFGDNHIFLK